MQATHSRPRSTPILGLVCALLGCGGAEGPAIDPFSASPGPHGPMGSSTDTEAGADTETDTTEAGLEGSTGGPATTAISGVPVDASTGETTGDAMTTDAGTDSSGGPCVPKTCEDKGAECGTIKDGCGGKVDCGGCGDGEACEGHQCVCAGDTCEPGQCHEVPDGCGGTMDCGVCDPMVAFCDDATNTCDPHGLACDGSYDHEDECAFGVNPCKWSCNPIFNNTDQAFIPPCCDVIKATGDPFACCFDARRVCKPEQCAGIPDGVNKQKCGQMWANGCCPVATDACPLPH